MICILGHLSAAKAKLGQGATWTNEVKVWMKHAPEQDRAIDLLVCRPVCYHRATAAPDIKWRENEKSAKKNFQQNGRFRPHWMSQIHKKTELSIVKFM